jgi:hypothetical protein
MKNQWNILMKLLLAGILAIMMGSTEAEGQKPGPAFPRLAVVPFVVKPSPFENAPKRIDEEAIIRKLSEASTIQAERVLVSRRIAATTERVESKEAAIGKFVLTGVVRLPVALTDNALRDAGFRSGRFATAEVTLWTREGTACARQEVQLVWSDGWWMYGARYRRTRNLDDVLVEFAQKATDRAVNRIVREKGFREMLVICDREMEEKPHSDKPAPKTK